MRETQRIRQERACWADWLADWRWVEECYLNYLKYSSSLIKVTSPHSGGLNGNSVIFHLHPRLELIHFHFTDRPTTPPVIPWLCWLTLEVSNWTSNSDMTWLTDWLMMSSHRIYTTITRLMYKLDQNRRGESRPLLPSHLLRLFNNLNFSHSSEIPHLPVTC